MLTRIVAFAAIISLAHPAAGHEPGAATQAASQMSGVAKDAAVTVDSFHAALRRGDTKAAAGFLADDALIFEAGGVERSKAEYSAHHLPADAEFSQAVPAAVTRRAGGLDGNLAWIASEGTTKGTFRGRAIDRTTAETMLLRRSDGAWRITHIHWSSAAVKAVIAPTSVPLLTGSVPANGAVVNGPINRLELHFAPPARLMEVTVSGPGGQMPMMVTSAGDQAHYALPLSALASGSYTVDWRAIAAGREDRGSFSFTVR